MSEGVPIGLEMESRYAGNFMWECPKCKKRGKFTFNNSLENECKRCDYVRKK